MWKNSALDITFPKFFDLGGKLSNLFSSSIFFPAKLYMYLDCPAFLGHLVVAVSRSSPGKFFSDEKVRAKNSDI